MKLVVIESPLAGDFVRNLRYARLCVIDSLRRGEAPYASHLLFTQVLDDKLPEDRKLGIAAGFAWGARAELCAIYHDLGVSSGMQAGIDRAVAAKIPHQYRTLIPSELARLDQEDIRSTEGIR